MQAIGESESCELAEKLEQIGEGHSGAKQLIDNIRDDFSYTPFVEPLDLDSVLDDA